ncbi:pentatricopeptide repeat-containing protein, putative [Ricinus communis]|uniref:Pentatricopeptide repeat-containing protein, putative n=1 Tax=Ricinus communis TaxID=3988 RepID=B9R9B6_RICCO|nr:pentatricopeptide repeat-containing protein, putative [Ricinus communis]|eukprot:XP_002510791.1 pentatricopeptide repeat-containing protein At3g60050 [Ricinus communis]
MNTIALSGTRMVHKFSYILVFSRKLCDCSFDGDKSDNGFRYIEEPLKRLWKNSDFGSCGSENRDNGNYSQRKWFFENVRIDAARVLDILRQDGPGFDAKAALSELDLRVSGLLVREVLAGILRNIGIDNKTRCAKLGYKFFIWSSQQENYRHTANNYHLIMKIFADCEEFKAMWRLLDEMVENGFPTTARTFNILICTCGGAGLARKVVERFIKSKTFNYRPFKHSYNAILLSLLAIREYKLIEWVHQQMLVEGYCPDTLTYNILMCAKYRLGKLHHFHRLLDEMGRSGFSPDFHTYNILLHVLGKGNKPIAALKLLNHMKEIGFDPSILHFTTLIDGLSRAGNLDACNYFFDEMIKNGFVPDVVCYTVMITGYIVAGELEKAREIFDEMIARGQLPNVFTYNSMIRGLCMAGKFEEARCMLKEMGSRGCKPNFLVYNTLVNNLRNAGKLSEAREVIKEMAENGQYVHRLKVQGM